ncbi:MAG: hypothetical protein AMS22_03000 [Thiotrichales bacterium SG8_50]|nr:MAG: hypothetical protein AMS22_03000 [Thiotrichales bacterium SG8_50]
MAAFLTPCRGAVMAGLTIAGNALMVPSATHKGCRGMTEMAIQTGLNVVRGLAPCAHTVTGGAIVYNTSVIESCGDKSAGVVADTAILSGLNMPILLAPGKNAIMTGLAVARDARVIEGGR